MRSAAPELNFISCVKNLKTYTAEENIFTTRKVIEIYVMNIIHLKFSLQSMELYYILCSPRVEK